jgi:septum formation protein
MTDLIKEQFHYVYLASKSPRRRAILKKMGVRFELIVFSKATGVDLDEKPLHDEDINEYSERITTEKLELGWNAVSDRKLLPSPVLVADTCIWFKEQIIGKPSNLDDAFNILTKLSGNIHTVYTTIAIQYGDKREIISTKSEVKFRKLLPNEIRKYISFGESIDKAGAYSIQDRGEMLIDEIKGSYSNIIGLPIPTTLNLLRKFNVNVF